MMFRVLGDRIAVKLLPGAGKIGTLFIPDSQKSTRSQTFQRARVVSVGSEVRRVFHNSTVLVTEYFGDEVEVAGEKLRVGRERDVVGVLVNEGLAGEFVSCVEDRVLISPLEGAKMAGVIHLPEDRHQREVRGVVLSAGPDCEVRRDEVVLYPPKRAVEVRWGEKLMHWIEEPAVLAVER